MSAVSSFAAMAAIEVDGVSKRFGTVVVLVAWAVVPVALGYRRFGRTDL